MASIEEPRFDAPIPGMGMTHELGGRPWQTPPQYPTVEQAIQYYIPRVMSKEFKTQMFDVMELGIPVTTLANTLQLSSVMDGKHSTDVGIIILPVLMELMMLVADEVDIKYTTGLDKPNKTRESAIDLAVKRLQDASFKDTNKDEPTEKVEQDMEEKPSKGFMTRRTA